MSRLKITKFKIVRTQFSVYEIIVGNTAFVGVTGLTVRKAVRNLLFYVGYGGFLKPNNSNVRKQLISAKELRELGVTNFVKKYVHPLGSFDRSSDAQVAAIRRQNELSHQYDMASKHPGQTIGSRQLFSDETLAKFQRELNRSFERMSAFGAIYKFRQRHCPFHGYAIEKEGV